MNGCAIGCAIVGAALSVAALYAADAWEQRAGVTRPVETTKLPDKASKGPALAFDPQEAFGDFRDKVLGEARSSRPLSQPGQPWSFNPPPGQLRPIIIDLNAPHRTEL